MKNLLLGMLTGLLLVSYLPQLSTITKIDMPVDKPLISVEKTNLIDKAAVMKAVTSKAYIIGLEGNLNKSLSYDDSLSQSSTFDLLAKRKFDVTFDARFLIGIDAEHIKIIIKNNTVIIALPEPTLIALEPSNVKFQEQNGLFRIPLTDDYKLYLLNKATESAKVEAMSQANKDKATESIKSIITKLIKSIPKNSTL